MIERLDASVSAWESKPTTHGGSSAGAPTTGGWRRLIRSLAPLYDRSAVISLSVSRLHGAALEL